MLAVDVPAHFREIVEERGWTWADGEDRMDVIDLESAQAWLRGRFAVEPVSALNLWNMATDVAYSLNLGFPDRGRAANACYEKLNAANLPVVYGRAEYTPVWTPRELRSLRSVLGYAVHILRHGCGV